MNQIVSLIFNIINNNLHWFVVGGLLTVFAKNPDKMTKKYYYGLAIVWIVLTFLKRI